MKFATLNIDFSEEEKREMLNKATSEQLALTLTYLPKKDQEDLRTDLSGVVFEAFAKVYKSKLNSFTEIVGWLDNEAVEAELREWVKARDLWDELDTVLHS